MDDELITDLKQFITATVTQATSDLATKDDVNKLEQKLEQKIDGVEQKLEQKIDDVDLKLDTIADTLNGQLTDHETRITSLEQQAA